MAKAGAIDHVIALTPSNTTRSQSGELFAVTCSSAGNVTVRLAASGATHVIPVTEGYSVYPYRVEGVNTTGTTATATYANLISS